MARVLRHSSDGDTPQKLAEQVTAIYPILPGQKASDRNAIPQHASAGNPTTTSHSDTHEAPADLIDFSHNEPSAAAPVPAENPAVAAVAQGQPSKDSTEIRNLLSSTGEKAPDGPLLDFTSDMKSDLPKTQPGVHSHLQRTQTEESNDDFFDAQS